MSKEKKKNKIKKKQGPIRTGAVIPFIVFVTVVTLFNIFLLDSTIKSTIEFVGGKINGAEVNVSKVETKFLDLSFTVHGVQFTNKNKPKENLFKIDTIKFQMLWDGVLRGKGVIKTAEVNGILLGAKRKRAGEVYPEEFDEKTGNNVVAQKALEKVEKEFEGNVFGDIASVLAGGSTGDVASNIEGQLESKKRFEKLQEEVKVAEKKLDADLAKVPSSKKLKSFEKRFKDINWNDLGNILKAPKVLKKADDLKKDIDKAIKAVENANENTKKSITSLNKSYKEAESLISKDINSVSKRMNLPTLDQASIARMIFGPEVLSKVKEAKKYQTMAEKYMPPKKEKKPVAIKTNRSEGRDYQFGKPNSYPLFWLKKAQITSENEQGKIKGMILDVTNDQRATGKLTKVDITGDFPPLSIRDAYGKLTIDHRDEAIANVDAGVGSFIVKDKALSKSKDVTFAIKQSEVQTKIKGQLTKKRVNLKINNRFTKISYETKAKSKALDEVLSDVAKKTKVLTLDAKASGKWESIKFDVRSNLAKAIENSVRSLVKEKIEAAQRKIKADIERQIASEKAKVDNQINKLKNDVNKELAKVNNEFKKLKSKVKNEEKKAKKKVKKSLGNPLKGISL